MKAKDLIPASRPRNPVVRQQQTSGAGAHRDKKQEQKKGYEKHKQKQFVESDNPWGDQGRFAGDTKVDIGGTTLKKIESGDAVYYFGEKARVVDLDYTNDFARISANGKTLNVKLSDLKTAGRS
jgi:hypothetical protein